MAEPQPIRPRLAAPFDIHRRLDRVRVELATQWQKTERADVDLEDVFAMAMATSLPVLEYVTIGEQMPMLPAERERMARVIAHLSGAPVEATRGWLGEDWTSRHQPHVDLEGLLDRVRAERAAT